MRGVAGCPRSGGSKKDRSAKREDFGARVRLPPFGSFRFSVSMQNFSDISTNRVAENGLLWYTENYAGDNEFRYASPFVRE